MQTVECVWSWRDEAALALLLSGFEVVAEPSCCLACAVRQLACGSADRPMFAVLTGSENRPSVVVGSFDGQPVSERARQTLRGTFDVFELCRD